VEHFKALEIIFARPRIGRFQREINITLLLLFGNDRFPRRARLAPAAAFLISARHLRR
jgi:hypothetical protein